MIFLLTSNYPYGEFGESFLENEMAVFEKMPLKITILPFMYDGHYQRPLPKNAILNNSLAEYNRHFHLSMFLRILFSTQLGGLLVDSFKKMSISVLFQGLKQLYGAYSIKRILRLVNIGDNDTFYTYWFSHLALGVNLFIRENKLSVRFISRAHRFDVYEDNVRYYPILRKEILETISNVYVVSQEGTAFLRGKYPLYSYKIDLSRLGVPDYSKYSSNIDNNGSSISYISCSNVIPVKRVLLIYECIKSFCIKNKNKSVIWTHLGDGCQMQELKKQITTHPANLKINLVGSLKHSDVIETYKNNHYDIFVNLSESEGIPVSIMEALSFGIPIIATNVGGNSEIVNGKTGALLPANPTSNDFNEASSRIIDNREQLFKTMNTYYYENYNSDVNYKRFYNSILNKYNNERD